MPITPDQHTKRTLQQALAQAGITVCNKSTLEPLLLGGTRVCFRKSKTDIELVFISKHSTGTSLNCSVSLKPLAEDICRGFFLNDSEAVSALADAIHYLRGEVTELLPNLCQHLGQRRMNTLDKASVDEASARFPHIKELFDKARKLFEEGLSEAEAKRKALEKQLRAQRERRGGSSPKHNWTDNELGCLAGKYDDLKPIWLEAKRIAKSAQKSGERSRRTSWRAEVLGAYPFLPEDLLERFSSPRSADAKPSDIALIHAKRECGIIVEYSARELRDKAHAWKLKTSLTTSATNKKVRKPKQGN